MDGIIKKGGGSMEDDSRYNKPGDGELMVTITLSEYRELVKASADKARYLSETYRLTSELEKYKNFEKISNEQIEHR